MIELPYRPSWVDRLTAYIEKLPVSPWLVYMAVAVPWVVVFIAVQAWQGAYRAEGFYAWHIFVAVQPLYGVMVIHYLDRVAANALRQFRPVMTGGEIEFDAALFRLTTLPARQAGVVGLLGALSAVIQLLLSGDAETVASFQNVAPTPISLAFHHINITVAWVGYGASIYHAYHQLKIIDWLYTSRAMIDPFYPEPLYALSEITSRTAMLILAAIYGWFSVVTGGKLSALPSEPLYYLTSAFMIGVGLVVFVWPLLGAHRLLVDAKNSALESNASSYKAALGELHSMVSTRKLDETDVWHKILAMLDMERRHLDRLPTWPWSPGALRNLLIALIMPILVWIAQFGLQQLLE